MQHHPLGKPEAGPRIVALCASEQLAYRHIDTQVAIAWTAHYSHLNAADSHAMRLRLRRAYTVTPWPMLREGTQPRRGQMPPGH